MRKLAYLLLSTILVCLCAATVMAQRAVTPEVRDRLRARQRALEDPENNPIKIEPYDPLRPGEKRDPLAPRSPLRATVELQVVGIADGDTLIINNTANQPMRIRLQGIDAPEAKQSFGSQAHENLSRLIANKWVSIEFDPRGKPDKDGRIIAKVYLDGRDIGLEQIKAGLAWFCKDYKKEQTESDRYTYAEAENEARSSARGLWREASPLAPWKYRQQ